MLQKDAFQAAFLLTLDVIRDAEQTTRRELAPLSRTLLQALHGIDADALMTGDLTYINKLIPVLTTPVQKFFVAFLGEFSGYHFDEKLNCLTKKNGKTYLDCLNNARKFLEDPHNNLFTWAKEQQVAGPWTLAKVTTFMDRALKKAVENDISRSDVLKAALTSGFTPVEIMEVIEQMAKEKAEQEPEPALM
jgi:hypothetical protein